MKDIKKLNLRAFLVAGVVFLGFLVGSFIYVGFVRQWNEEQSIQSLNDTTSQRASTIRQQIEGDLQLLKGIAITLAEMDIRDREHVNFILDRVNRSNEFVRMGLAELNGNIDLLDLDGEKYNDVNISQYPFFRRVRAGYPAVSRTFYEELTDEEVNYYAVPVIQKSEVEAILVGVNNESKLRNAIAEPVFRGEGYFAIINRDGIITAPTVDSTSVLVQGANVFDIISIGAAEKQRMETALDDYQHGNFVFSMAGIEQLVTIQPLNVNDWLVLSVVPRSTIDSYYNRTAIGISLIIVASGLFFLFLMYRQVTMMSRNQQRLERLAYTDLLTGARNFTKFQRDARAILKQDSQRHYAIWSYDIKKFNSINDIFGNTTGDRVLKRTAAVFNSYVDAHSIFCRVSADNFAGIRAYKDKNELTNWFFELSDTLSVREIIPEDQMHLDASMGFYCIDDFPERPSINDMVNRATISKRNAKQKSGSEMMFFTSELSERLRWETELEAAGEMALQNQEMTFFLQPKVSIEEDYQIIGAEALARWKHPQYGWISPAEFIPLFENNGFIVQLDRYIFEQVCKWYVRWRDEENLPLRIAVNVSRQGLLRDDFVEHYSAVKERYGIADNVLELEITESIIMQNSDTFQNAVLALQSNGFICSIDDFGSGYSSLNVLKSLPINVLKLDALFFREWSDVERSQVVVASFIEMAKRLQIKTVAEGVETTEQVDFLQRAGCNIIQGYVFSKPLEQQQFEQLLKTTNGRLYCELPPYKAEVNK